MNSTVAQLDPQPVWTFFEQLNEVPRPSKREQRVIAWVCGVGAKLGLSTEVDGAGNVVIRKPAAKGMENRVPVVLQSHLDMVHQKNADTSFDFETQGIQSFIDDGWVRAKGTTLGADNGIGVAAILAILAAKDLSHGPLEGLFTIDEETGLTGAANLKPGWLQGRILLNLDTEEHGDLCIGCAGGVDTVAHRQYQPTAPTGDQGVRIQLRGLKGGHSGCDIHLGRGNANKLLNRLVYLACKEFGAQLHRFDGGNLRNAIPREATAEIVLAKGQANEARQKLESLAAEIRAEYRRGEPELSIEISTCPAASQVLDADAQKDLVRAIYAAPNGVFRMSEEMPGLVETSTSLARVAIAEGKAQVEFLTRSSVESGKRDLTTALHAVFRLAGCDVDDVGGYPGWRPNADSPILALVRRVFEEQFGSKPNVNAVHAGLECGIIGGHYPGMDMISFGPTIRHPHSPDEKCEIASVRKFWDLLVAVLAQVPDNG